MKPAALLYNIARQLRRRLVDSPRGFGHPVPKEAFDTEFRSGHWQLLASKDENNRYRAIVQLILAQNRDPSILDVGCGSGRLAAELEPSERGAYEGIDFSAEAIYQARRTVSACTFYQIDVEQWQPERSYDVIVLNEVLGYFHDPLAVLTKLSSHLNPGGVLIASLYRWGNSSAIWRRISKRFTEIEAQVISNLSATKYWDLRVLIPKRN